ncbi:MAG: ATP-binding cassette domain-containing protein [Myxococcales bacterium]
MFELTSVAKRFAGGGGVQPLSLAVPAGETLALIGPSGCGKSTLLRLMVGLVKPDEGRVRFGGEDVTSDKALALRRRLGFVVQGGGLFPHLTGAGNAALMARYTGWEEARIAARLEELARLVRLPAEMLARFPAQLSGGQAQRVSLMRALMLDPEVLLLDEPLGALDPITRYELQDDLHEIFARLRKTVVLVTHDLAEAAFFGARIALMREGRIVQIGTLDQLSRAPAEPFVTRFLHAQRSPLLRGEPA